MRCALEWTKHIDCFKAISHLPVGLKMYGARLGMDSIAELPLDPDKELVTVQQIEDLKAYNANDLRLTAEFYKQVLPNIEMKAGLCRTLGVDLRTARFSQIAERVIYSKVQASRRATDEVPERWRWTPPKFMGFKTPVLRELLQEITDSDFVLDKKGMYRVRQSIKDRRIPVGEAVYQIGVGGLHSVDAPQVHLADGETRIFEYDVQSYYPSLINALQIRPLKYGQDFNRLYEKMYQKRMTAVAEGDSTTAGQLKLVLNAFGGKLGNRHSNLYSPERICKYDDDRAAGASDAGRTIGSVWRFKCHFRQYGQRDDRHQH